MALILCLGKPADMYLLDEPSAYLDSEQRIIASKVIKRFITHSNRSAFVVEHDFIMATYLADSVVVYEGRPGIEARHRRLCCCLALLCCAPSFVYSIVRSFIPTVGWLVVGNHPTDVRACVWVVYLAIAKWLVFGCSAFTIVCVCAQATATAPQPLLSGMNKFLKQLEITFRRDPANYRPRINKRDSVKDREQKAAGNYFYMGEDE